jgi:alpha-L-fucosidase 2
VNWNEALPLGNGHLGAMVFGKTDAELIQLNDNTLYSGEPTKNEQPPSSGNLKNVLILTEYVNCYNVC